MIKLWFSDESTSGGLSDERASDGLGDESALRMGLTSSPTSCSSMCISKRIPMSRLKHSLIIHRRGMRARVLGVPFFTDPPPISEKAFVNSESVVRRRTGIYRSGRRRRTPLQCRSSTRSNRWLDVRAREATRALLVFQSYGHHSRGWPRRFGKHHRLSTGIRAVHRNRRMGRI